MKCLVILLISVISLVAADGVGDYVPKSFYFIDANGKPTNPQPISQETLNRARRQAPGFNTGFNQGFGGFAFPQPVFNFPQPQPGQSGTQGFTSTSQVLSSRFGDDEPVITGQTQTFHSSGNKFTQTTTNLRPDGSVDTNKQTGRVKRDTMSQTQSQGSQDGKTQFQSQSNNAPGGVQIQSQNQPGMSQSQTQGSPNEILTTKGSFDVVQEPEQDHVQQLEPQDSVGNPADRAQNGGQNQNNGQRPPPQNNGQRPPPINQQNNDQRPPPQHSQQGPPPQQQNFPQGQPQQGPPPQQHNQQPQGPPPQHNNQQGPPPQQNYPQGQPQQPPYNPQQGGQQFPFGFGQFGFPQQGFGFPQQGFGFPQQMGFGQPGFGFPQAGFGFPQAGFAQPGFPQPGQIGSLDNRFGEDEIPTGTVGGSTHVSNVNGNYQITSSVLRPDGQVVTSQQSGNAGRHYHG